jgi:hypothetical protein
MDVQIGVPEGVIFRVVYQDNADQRLPGPVLYSKSLVLLFLFPCSYRHPREESLSWSFECNESMDWSRSVRFLLRVASSSTTFLFSPQPPVPEVSLDKVEEDPTNVGPLVVEDAV